MAPTNITVGMAPPLLLLLALLLLAAAAPSGVDARSLAQDTTCARIDKW